MTDITHPEQLLDYWPVRRRKRRPKQPLKRLWQRHTIKRPTILNGERYSDQYSKNSNWLKLTIHTCVNIHHHLHKPTMMLNIKSQNISYRGCKHASSKPHSIPLHVMRNYLDLNRLWLWQKKMVYQNQCVTAEGTSLLNQRRPNKFNKFSLYQVQCTMFNVNSVWMTR
jgi:hypothetical protein